jgi:GH15 family glucan-1,4-alpha-glucosidase
MNTNRVEQLLDESRVVLENCALTNGAIVAANSDLSVYPPEAENYRFVWGRDNAFQMVAASALEMPTAPDIRVSYLKWLNERAEGFAETGLIIKRYSTNGGHDARYGDQYQPDQAGALLWSLAETQTDPDDLTENTIRLLANGLSGQWDVNSFRVPTQDLWENRTTNPEQQDVFTYSLAAAAHGLGRAIKLWQGKTGEVDRWTQTREEMLEIIEWGVEGPHYLRKMYPTLNEDNDNTLDASLDGLVYPFTLDEKQITILESATTLAIDRHLCQTHGGVARYDGDTYDGIARPGLREATAGRWPLLTFWHVIALRQIGRRGDAVDLYSDTVDQLDDLYKSGIIADNQIPEQLFGDEREGKAILPLAWSHAMFVLATKELGLGSFSA